MHRQDFERREHRFVHSDAYSVTTQLDMEEGARLWIVHVHKQPPLERWGALIGECLFNFRSALDHLAYDLAVAYSGSPLRSELERGSEFPIYWRSAPTKKDLDWKLGGLHPEARHLIKEMQPHNRPDRAALMYLDKLHNFDKHRTLHLVSGVARAVGHLGEPPFFDVSFSPFEDGDVIAYGLIEADPKGDNNPTFTFGVAFSEAGPGSGYAVSLMLDWIGEHIEQRVIAPLLPYL